MSHFAPQKADKLVGKDLCMGFELCASEVDAMTKTVPAELAPVSKDRVLFERCAGSA